MKISLKILISRIIVNFHSSCHVTKVNSLHAGYKWCSRQPIALASCSCRAILHAFLSLTLSRIFFQTLPVAAYQKGLDQLSLLLTRVFSVCYSNENFMNCTKFQRKIVNIFLPPVFSICFGCS